MSDEERAIRQAFMDLVFGKEPLTEDLKAAYTDGRLTVAALGDVGQVDGYSIILVVHPLRFVALINGKERDWCIFFLENYRVLIRATWATPSQYAAIIDYLVLLHKNSRCEPPDWLTRNHAQLHCT